MLDYIRMACAVPPVQVGNVEKNAKNICAYIARADEQNADFVIFPELALTGYSCQDLIFQDALHKAAARGVERILACSAEYPKIGIAVGVAVSIDNRLYNCGAVISGGKLRGLVPKTYIPNYNEFIEKRWFASGGDLKIRSADVFGEKNVAIGTDLLFRFGDGTVLGMEICEDLWSPLPPSGFLALEGAEVLVNLSASTEAVGKRANRRNAVKQQSASCSSVYAYCSAGATESTQDVVFSGQCIVAENGRILEESQDAIVTEDLLICDCDLGKLRADRQKNSSFGDCVARFAQGNVRKIDLEIEEMRGDGSFAKIQKLPFVPSQQAERNARCMEIFHIQVAGLKQRLSVLGTKAVIGISGGLDSTLALLVAVEAMRQLGRPLTDVYGVTMPCFGTSDRTYQNSWELMRTLGISAKEINIRNAVELHFRDIGHDQSVLNGTYENSQARERTQILMDYASVVGGIVVGTGDLSELALGWCTYNGDHMSMYGVNASVPKTLIRWIIEAIAEKPDFAASKDVLMDILDTPISPELLPPDAQGKISQHTEDLVGPYALHDFFLYYVLRFGFAPKKIYTLACRAFADDFDSETVKKWLKTFYRRFFTQQFKRNCQPDGVKVGSVCLSPRGDWRMPSDASGRAWLQEAENL